MRSVKTKVGLIQPLNVFFYFVFILINVNMFLWTVIGFHLSGADSFGVSFGNLLVSVWHQIYLVKQLSSIILSVRDYGSDRQHLELFHTILFDVLPFFLLNVCVLTFLGEVFGSPRNSFALASHCISRRNLNFRERVPLSRHFGLRTDILCGRCCWDRAYIHCIDIIVFPIIRDLSSLANTNAQILITLFSFWGILCLHWDCSSDSCSPLYLIFTRTATFLLWGVIWCVAIWFLWHHSLFVFFWEIVNLTVLILLVIGSGHQGCSTSPPVLHFCGTHISLIYACCF